MEQVLFPKFEEWSIRLTANDVEEIRYAYRNEGPPIRKNQLCDSCEFDEFFTPISVYQEIRHTVNSNSYFYSDRRWKTEFEDYLVVESVRSVRIFKNYKLIMNHDFGAEGGFIFVYSFKVSGKTFYCYLLNDDMFLLPTCEKIIENIYGSRIPSCDSYNIHITKNYEFPYFNGELYIQKTNKLVQVFKPELSNDQLKFKIIREIPNPEMDLFRKKYICCCNPRILVWYKRSKSHNEYIDLAGPNGHTIDTSKARFVHWKRVPAAANQSAPNEDGVDDANKPGANERRGKVLDIAIEITNSSLDMRHLRGKADSQECDVCYEPLSKRFTIIPCGHTRTCESCIKNIRAKKLDCSCGCGKPIREYIRIYI